MRAAVFLTLLTIAILTVSCGGDSDSAPPSSTSGLPTSSSLATATFKGGWTSLAPLPTPRSEVAVAGFAGHIYVVGGFEANGSVSQKVEIYDPENDTWSEAPPLPMPRHHAAAIGWSADLLVIGGYQSGFSDPQTTVFRFDPHSAVWSENPPLAIARGGHAVATNNGRPVVAGGAGADGKSLASAELMDPQSGAWLLLDSEMSVARDHLAAASLPVVSGSVVSNPVFAIGGRRDTDFGSNLDANESAVPPGPWEAAAPLPTARSGIAAAALGGRIYVFGGEGPSGTFAENEVYDPATNTWTAAAPMPTARHGLGAAVSSGVIYVIGGGPTPGLSVTGANEAFRP